MILPQETTILLLMFPVIATAIAFLRQVIGIKAFGIYTPLIMTFAFLSTGIKQGMIIFLVVLLSGTLARILVKKLRLLYLPRMAIVLSLVVGVIFLLFWIYKDLSYLSIFPILIIITMVEKFVAAQIERGFKTALWLSIETLFLSTSAYFLASWNYLQVWLTNYPWLLILTLVINFALGKWTGLRLIEYFKYREVLRNADIN